MATLNDIPVPFTILRDPPPVVRGGPGGKSGTMTFYMALNDAPAFVEAIAGTTEVIPLPGGGTVERVVPLVHPDHPDMYVVAYEQRAMGTPGGVWGTGLSVYTEMFSHAVIEVEFQTLPFILGSDEPWFTLTVDSGHTIETLPDQAFYFSGPTEELTGEAGIPIPIVQYNLTTYMGTSDIGYDIALLSGRVNSVEFEGFPPGFLRYAGTRSEKTRGGAGQSLVKSYSLAFRPIEWNKSMRRSGVWDVPSTSGGYLKYLTADLNLLKYY
jgi:hypothetical protein